MRFQLSAAAALFLCFSACAKSASKPFAMRGHVLGEPLQQLVALEPSENQRIEECRKGAAAEPWADRCPSLLSAVRGERGEVLVLYGNTDSKETTGLLTLTLEANRVVKMESIVPASFDDTADTLNARLGKNNVERAQELENYFGARWTERMFVWEKPDMFVSLIESKSPGQPGCYLSILTHSEFKRWEKAGREKPSPLDR